MQGALRGQKDTSDYGQRNSAVVNEKQMETCNTFSAEIKNNYVTRKYTLASKCCEVSLK